ncbi:MAG: 3'-5' exonuclease [Colwellia sp.]
MYVLGIDVETTGLSPDNDKIIELGAVVWDADLNKPVAMMNHLISIGEQQLREKTTQLTGITDSDLTNFGIDEQQALLDLLKLSEKCDYMVAHNGNKFDKPFIDNALAKYGLKLSKSWIDSLFDVPYPCQFKKRRLGYLADEHGCSIAFAHRAQFDVLAMLQICSHYDWQKIIELQKIPVVTIIANVSYEERDKAKSAGFYFDRNTSKWKKKLKESQLDSLCYDFEYSVND